MSIASGKRIQGSGSIDVGGYIETASDLTVLGDCSIEGDCQFDSDVVTNSDVQIQGTSAELKVSGTSAKVGVRTSSPTSALDVNGTIKATDININAKGFFVGAGTQGDYLQAKDYGTAQFTLLSGATNQPKTTPAFGNTGKFIENTRIKTIKLQGTGFTGLGTAAQIVAAAGAGKYCIPLQMTIFNDYGTRAGEWGSNGSQASIQIGTFQNSDNTGNFAPFLTLPVTTAENTGDWVAHKTFRNIESKQFPNRDIVIKAVNSNYPSSEANAPDGAWYITLEYTILDETDSFISNVDTTIGSAF